RARWIASESPATSPSAIENVAGTLRSSRRSSFGLRERVLDRGRLLFALPGAPNHRRRNCVTHMMHRLELEAGKTKRHFTFTRCLPHQVLARGLSRLGEFLEFRSRRELDEGPKMCNWRLTRRAGTIRKVMCF